MQRRPAHVSGTSASGGNFFSSQRSFGGRTHREEHSGAYFRRPFPCRVSLADAPEGARVFLLNYEHQPNQTPYRSRHAIFVMEGAQESHPEPGTIPASISSRLLSVRAFNKRHDIIDAEVIDGKEVAGLLPAYFARPEVNYVHLHYAGRGCYAAKVTRAP
ncbi:DUF1203 domain-containing protein [Roseibium salinum]|uniref:DUF1203 domain-containing protein n=1 Tax=Roseibium salinum TaxID=1604349 RepID=UPI0036160E1C